MPPLYFGKPVTGTAKPHPDFAARDVSLLKTDVATGAPKGVAYTLSLLYGAYIYYLSFFLKATILGKRIPTSRHFIGNFFEMKMRDFMPVPFPTVVIAQGSKAADFDALVQDIEGIVSGGKGGKKAAVYNVDAEKYSKILRSNIDTNAACDTGRSNVEDFGSFLNIVKIFTAFFLTHQYPGALDEIEPSTHLTADVNLSTELSVTEFEFEDLNRRRLVVPAELDEEDEDMEHSDAERNFTSTSKFYEVVTKAKPSLKNFTYHGNFASVPFLPGLFFGYFPDCITPSYSSIATLISDYFFSNLGDDIEECASELRVIRKATAQWCSSSAGLILQHIGACIRIAIQSETRPYLIFEDGEYQGFVLLGYGFSVVDAAGLVVKPHMAKELRDVLRDANTNLAALAEVKQAAENIAVENGNAYVDQPDTLMCDAATIISARQVVYYLRERDVLFEDVETENMEKLMKAMRRAFFTTGFWKVNPDTILKGVLLLTNNDEIPESLPMGYHSTMFTDTSREFSVFSLFGVHGFSFVQHGGTQWRIPKSGEEDPADQTRIIAGKVKGKDARQVKKLDVIYVAMKPVSACIVDWRYMHNERCIVQKSERAAKQKNYTLSGDKRDAIWTELKMAWLEKDKTAVEGAAAIAAAAPVPVVIPSKRKLQSFV